MVDCVFRDDLCGAVQLSSSSSVSADRTFEVGKSARDTLFRFLCSSPGLPIQCWATGNKKLLTNSLNNIFQLDVTLTNSKQESRAVAWKPRDAAAAFFGSVLSSPRSIGGGEELKLLGRLQLEARRAENRGRRPRAVAVIRVR